MDLNKVLEDAKETLSSMSPGLINSAAYNSTCKMCARLCLDIGGDEKELEAIHYLTEAHGVGLRQFGVQERLRADRNDATECLSFLSEKYAKSGPSGLLERLKEMPTEWTVIQLTREFDPLENVMPRPEGQNPKLRHFHVTRMPCGSPKIEKPFTVDCSWPANYNRDPIDVFAEVKAQFKRQTEPFAQINKFRREASKLAENYCEDLATSCFNVWRVFLLGKLIDGDLEAEIRTRLNYIFEKISSNVNEISDRQRYLVYLLAEGSALISDEEIDLGLIQILPTNEALQDELYNEILAIKSCYSQLPSAKRNSVILILDDHFDHIPWESCAFLKAHPYCRIPSIHFLHAAFRIHRDNIKDGLLEISGNEVAFYILNPDNDLPSDNILKFLKSRFPSWVGVINQPPTHDQFIEALTTYKLFMYCGHGNGSQYFNSTSISKLKKIQSLQFLIGCSSGALKDHGGDIEMTGDILQYIAAGSGCTIAMLWAITNTDADLMTMEMMNCLLLGTQNGSKNLKEPELLRALTHARRSAHIFSNAAALTARGLPVKFISAKR